jgi:uncharacterized protein DUF4338
VAQSDLRRKFLTSFVRDLRKINIRATVHPRDQKLVFDAVCKPLSERQLLATLSSARTQQLSDNWSFVEAMQKAGVAGEFAVGSGIDPRRIQPSLHLCDSRKDRDLFEFCRLMQAVPAPPLLYRRLAFLLRDAGHPGKPVMGIFGLSSSLYSLGSRDKFLGWTGNNADHKNVGLNCCMHLSVCMAVPPYNYLRVGRLLAALSLSDRVAAHFGRAYSRPDSPAKLLSVVTTAAMGIHAPIFNRIRLKKGGLFRRIGCTAGYSAVPFSPTTMALARALALQYDGTCPDNRSISTLKRALNLCQIPREYFVKLGTRKGVYFGVPDDGSLDALRRGSMDHTPVYPTVPQAVDLWRLDMEKALLIERNIRKLRSFNPFDCQATRKRGFWDAILR